MNKYISRKLLTRLSMPNTKQHSQRHLAVDPEEFSTTPLRPNRRSALKGCKLTNSDVTGPPSTTDEHELVPRDLSKELPETIKLLEIRDVGQLINRGGSQPCMRSETFSAVRSLANTGLCRTKR